MISYSFLLTENQVNFKMKVLFFVIGILSVFPANGQGPNLYRNLLWLRQNTDVFENLIKEELKSNLKNAIDEKEMVKKGHFGTMNRLLSLANLQHVNTEHENPFTVTQ